MPAYEEPPVLPGGSFFEDFSFICSPGGGWAARATEMGVNSCKWVCLAKRERKIPLGCQTRWFPRGLPALGRNGTGNPSPTVLGLCLSVECTKAGLGCIFARGKNRGSPPSSRRRQGSPGALHLDYSSPRRRPKEKGHPFGCPFLLVREAGLEPACPE